MKTVKLLLTGITLVQVHLKGTTVKLRVLVAGSLALLLAFASTGGALAHASLTRANIKNGAVLHVKSVPRTLQTFFAETLDPKQSWVNVFEGVGDHGLVNEKTKSIVNFKNPKEMTLRLPTLRPDRYYFVWYTHSEDDGHYAAGVVYFRVVK
jgi:methionine-rich copper-binding protein CopC